MSPSPLLDGLFNQTVQVEHCTGTDEYGGMTYGDPVTAAARIEIAPTVTLGMEGGQIPSYATIYVDIEIGENDRFTLPDGTIRSVLSIAKQVDLDGVFSHSEVKI